MCRQHATTERERNSVADKWIHEAGRISYPQNVISNGLRFGKHQRRNRDRFGDGLPITRTLRQRRMELQDLSERRSRICSHHRTRIHMACIALSHERNWLHAAISPVEEIQIDRPRMRLFNEMCFDSDPLGFTRSMVPRRAIEVGPTARGIHNCFGSEISDRAFDVKRRFSLYAMRGGLLDDHYTGRFGPLQQCTIEIDPRNTERGSINWNFQKPAVDKQAAS